MSRALSALLLVATAVWAGPPMESADNKLSRNVGNAGGEESSSGSNRLAGSIAEDVAFTTAASAGSVARAGFSELHAFPRTVTDLAGAEVHVTSVTLRWTTPGYDGHDGMLQVGSTYFIRVASYTVPDTFSDHRQADISFSTSGVNPGDVANIVLLGLLPSTTYWARIWTTDGDSNFAYASAISSFVLQPDPAPPVPPGGFITDVGNSSATATWGISIGATSYALVASTDVSLTPVTASSVTAGSTGTAFGLEPNTTYYMGVSACNLFFCSIFSGLGSTITLAVPAIALSSTAASSTTITLAWGANGNPAWTRYVVRRSTDDLTFLSVATVTATGTTIHGLVAATTYFIDVVALNEIGIAAPPSNKIGVRTPDAVVPGIVTGVSASAVLLGSRVSWDVLPSTAVGTGLLHYNVLRSTNAGFGFVVVTTVTATTFLDRPLTLGPTYYYRISGHAVDGFDGPQSAAASALPYNIAPMEPLGVQVQADPFNVALSWTRTTRFNDGTIFISTATPLADELTGYSVYRSTSLCSDFVSVSTMGYSSTTLVDAAGGLNYYYRVVSENTFGLSPSPVTVSSLGERSYFTDDCLSRVVLDPSEAQQLAGAANGGTDLRIVAERRPQDIGGGVFQSISWRALRDGVTELPQFSFPSAVRVVMRYETSGSTGVPSNVGKNLGIYWYNGAEFKKVYGSVDDFSQTVVVESPNLGHFQIRALARSGDKPTFDSSNLSGRVLTPNGDGLNDVIIFTYDPGINNDAVTGRIYDITGRHVADMRPGMSANTLVWDGKSNGRVVGGGPYVYRLQGGGRSYAGTIVVAR